MQQPSISVASLFTPIQVLLIPDGMIWCQLIHMRLAFLAESSWQTSMGNHPNGRRSSPKKSMQKLGICILHRTMKQVECVFSNLSEPVEFRIGSCAKDNTELIKASDPDD